MNWSKIKGYIQKGNIFCFFMGGFIMNMAIYFCWLILPLLMREHDGTSFEIGLADAITFGLCGLMCPIIGTLLNKRWFPIDDVCRIGFVFQALSTLIIGLYYITGTDLLPIFFILLLQAFGVAFFWAIVEYLLSNEIYKGETNKKMSWFACSWSLGKAIGFLLGGPMRNGIGNTFSLYFSSIMVMVAWIVFPRWPRNRSEITRKQDKLIRESKGDLDEEELERLRKEEEEEERKIKKKQKIPYYYMLYYFNTIVMHFAVYGTIAVFGNQYIDFVDEEKIILQGVSDDPGTFASVFLGVLYFSQTIGFFVFGSFHQWQYILTFNTFAQVIIAGISIGLIFLRNGWVLVVLAIPIGIISAYDLQSTVIYSINAGPKNKGKILGLSECVGELTCALCPLCAGLLATSFDDRRYALYQGIVLQVIGIIICVILHIITIVLERRRKKKIRNGEINENEVEMEEEEEEEEKTQTENSEKADVEVPIDIVENNQNEDMSPSISASSEDEEKPKDIDEIKVENDSVNENEIEKRDENEKEKEDKDTTTDDNSNEKDDVVINIEEGKNEEFEISKTSSSSSDN